MIGLQADSVLQHRHRLAAETGIGQGLAQRILGRGIGRRAGRRPAQGLERVGAAGWRQAGGR
jgi:hypothetical protein